MNTPRVPTGACALLCLVSFTAFWVAQRAMDVSLIDVMVYRAQGEAVRQGAELYGLRATHAHLPATYPPFAALLFTPLTLLGVPAMRTLATAGNLVLLVAVAHLSLRLAGRPLRFPRPAAALAVAAVAVWCEPVWTTLRYGQVNLLLAALVLWDLSRRPGHRWAGAGIGVAAGIKLTPALFAVYLALAGLAEMRRRVRRPRGVHVPARVREPGNPRLRQAAVAAGFFLATAVLSALVLPGASYRFWTGVLFHAERVGHAEDTANQSLHGVLARALHTGDPGAVATAASVATALLGLVVAVAALRAGPRLPHSAAWAATACAVTALLVSPVSWSHHWVWCVPVTVLLAAGALPDSEVPGRADVRRWRAAAASGLVFCSYALWWVPHSADRSDRLELHQSAGEMVLSAIYPVAGVGFLCLAAGVSLRAHRARPLAGEAAQVPAGRTVGGQAVAKE